MSDNITPNQTTKTRPPVVVILGHVDHGKTKLLDTIRQTKVAEGESGGITQHIGAYQAVINDQLITFLDTPGHEAFTAIRSRGAKVADIAILVVAADESVKPQTKEAIKIIKDAGIPFIVAINKIDKAGANLQKVRQDLAAEDVLTEDWGGQVPVVELSAKENRNIDGLLEIILLVAEVAELKEDLTAPSQGVIIESHLDKRRGYVATALVQKGVLKIGDWITAGGQLGKVKSMEDYLGQAVTEAQPSQPVLLTGWPEAPAIGRQFSASDDKKEIERATQANQEQATVLFVAPTVPDSGKVLNLILKSDVASSLEALDATLHTLPTNQVSWRVLGQGIGNITEGDVKTALNNKSAIFGFRVTIESSAQNLAEREHIVVASYDIIYELVEAVRAAMADLLEPEIKQTVLGKLRVLALFKQDGKTQIIGGKVTSGKLARGAFINVGPNPAKDGASKIGRITQLQQNKDDVPEVEEGRECGLRVELIDLNRTIKEGDILEVYEEERVKRSL